MRVADPMGVTGGVASTRRVVEALRSWFGAPVGIGVRVGGGPQCPALHPEEAALLSPGVQTRRRAEFALGRAAAHDALAQLGVEWAPIGRGPGGEPLWPHGIVGSITHEVGMAIAAVGWRGDHAGMGIDLARVEGTPSEGELRAVCTGAERAWVREDEGTVRERFAMVFAAKEAVYKALAARWPLVRPMGFADVEVAWHDLSGTFEAIVLPGEVGASLRVRVGCWWIEGTALAATRAPSS